MCLKTDVRLTTHADKELKKSKGFGHGLSADYITNAFNIAVKNEIKTNQQRGLPIAKYDTAKKRAYLEFPNGTREYVD